MLLVPLAMDRSAGPVVAGVGWLVDTRVELARACWRARPRVRGGGSSTCESPRMKDPSQRYGNLLRVPRRTEFTTPRGAAGFGYGESDEYFRFRSRVRTWYCSDSTLRPVVYEWTPEVRKSGSLEVCTCSRKYSSTDTNPKA